MLISKVRLVTNKLVETKNFYVNLLHFPVISDNQSEFTIQVGKTELTFQQSNKFKNPFYHFAFTIPSNQFSEAKALLQTKVELNREEEEDGNNEVYFTNISAHSFYFNDPSGNIVEYIARHSYPNISNKPFTTESILHISEINITTSDCISVSQQLNEVGIPSREEVVPHSLNFIGDKGSYLLVGPPERRWYFSTKPAKIFPLNIEINHKIQINVHSNGHIICFE